MDIRNTIYTYDDYLTLPDNGKKHEIIEGDILATPAPTTRHQKVVGRLYALLLSHVEKNNLGEVYQAPTDVIFSMTDIVQPDILFISNHRKEIITKKNIIAAPDLIAEIISDNTEKTDRNLKYKLYERSGVKEYWILDPERNTVDVFHLEEYKFIHKGVLSGQQLLASRIVDGFQVRVEILFV